MKFESLCVVGLGYIGLPTAATFASFGTKVLGVDVNEKAVETINQGKVHIIEPDLDAVVSKAVASGNLRAALTAAPADAFILAVPTPFKGDKQPDLKYIEAAANSIAPVLKKGDLVILESTSPVGATEQLVEWLAAARQDLSFPTRGGCEADVVVAHCPERVLPGKVMQELINNDRVIGGITPACSEAAAELYRTFVKGACVITEARTAEMCKLTENSFRDVNIAFANELSIICDKLDIDVWELVRLANRHPRVNILQPGPGVGGHCIAVDPWFIVASAPEEAKIIRAAREINDAKPEWVLEKVNAAVGKYLSENPNKTATDVTIACYGVAFKPDIDDLRESPALNIAQQLIAKHPGNVWVVEPNIKALPEKLKNGVLASYEQAGEADVHVMLVDHSKFIEAARPVGEVVDTKGIWPLVEKDELVVA